MSAIAAMTNGQLLRLCEWMVSSAGITLGCGHSWPMEPSFWSLWGLRLGVLGSSQSCQVGVRAVLVLGAFMNVCANDPGDVMCAHAPGASCFCQPKRRRLLLLALCESCVEGSTLPLTVLAGAAGEGKP